MERPNTKHLNLEIEGLEALGDNVLSQHGKERLIEFKAIRKYLEQPKADSEDGGGCEHDYVSGTQSNNCDVSVCTKCGEIS